MEITQSGIDFIKSWEGFRKNAYKDSGGLYTIGYGTIRYEDGAPVKRGDKISSEAATQLFALQLQKYVTAVSELVTSSLLPNQFDALVSFTYNVGIGNLKKSTLLKKVNKNPDDPAIITEFKKWVNAGGKFVKGLQNRRIAEAQKYFS